MPTTDTGTSTTPRKLTHTENPWSNFQSTPPFLLSEDIPTIAKFNEKQENSPFKIQTQLFPEPYVGNPETAEIILLSLNPGYSDQDDDFHRNNQNFREIIFENLNHTSKEYPFFPFNPSIKDSPVAKYWKKRLRELIDQSNEKILSNKICCIEYFPYHSKKYRQLKIDPISSNYNKQLIENCIQRRALIIIMRAKRKWLKLVPKLNDYSNCFTVHSFANPAITKNNLGEKVFAEILKKLAE